MARRTAVVPCAVAVGVLTLTAVAAVTLVQYESHKIIASDGLLGDQFGCAVAIEGDMALIGAQHYSDFIREGAVYSFEWDGTEWVEMQKLRPDVPQQEEYFGSDVALSGEWAVIGAQGSDTLGTNAGQAYAFHFDGTTWTQVQPLFASDAHSYDRFGSNVAIDGTTIVVTAPHDDDFGLDSGAAYVYVWDGATWLEEQKLLPDDGQEQMLFGSGVAIQGHTIVVGASSADMPEWNSGAVYIFEFDGTDWVQVQQLVASDHTDAEWFGRSVDVLDDTLLVGTPRSGGQGEVGRGYVFRFDGTEWIEEQILEFSGSVLYDEFAETVALGEGFAVIGAPEHSGTDAGGYAATFRFDGTEWVEHTELVASDEWNDNQFGCGLDVSGTTVMVGALKGEGIEWNAGATYTFDIVLESCDPDFDHDGIVGFTDLLSVLSAWGDTDVPQDLDASGEVDFTDLLIVLAAWGPC